MKYVLMKECHCDGTLGFINLYNVANSTMADTSSQHDQRVCWWLFILGG